MIILELVYTDNILGDGGQKGILWPILFFAFQGFFYWLLVFLTENNVPSIFTLIKNLTKRKNKVSDKVGIILKGREIMFQKNPNWELDDDQTGSIEDSDVLAEKAAVAHSDTSSAAVVVKDIKKW